MESPTLKRNAAPEYDWASDDTADIPIDPTAKRSVAQLMPTETEDGPYQATAGVVLGSLLGAAIWLVLLALVWAF